MKNTAQINRLASYSLLSISFMLTHDDVNGEVIYTDLEPDVVLPGPYDLYPLDIDNSGEFELRFYNFSILYYSYTNFSYRRRQAIMIDSMNMGVYIAALTDWTYYSAVIKYPFALASGELIDDNTPWYNKLYPWDNFLLAARTYVNVGAGTGTLHCFNCDWYNIYSPETVNGYLAIKFKIDTEVHYGWIRCDVLDEGRTLIIKDYAYEAEPDNPIIAGDTTHFVGISSPLNSLDVQMYSYGKSVYLKLAESTHAITSIYDIAGNEILTREIDFQSSVINMSEFPAGVYLITLQSGEKTFSKKLSLE